MQFRLPIPVLSRVLLMAAATLLTASAYARDLIVVEAGTLPIILTAPHGGNQDVPGCAVRTPTGTRFVTGPDQDTDILARGIVDEITRLTGKSPYLVMARFHRKYIDANRRADEAYGAAGCQADYEFYHATIRRLVNEIRAQHPQAMLFDIHGQTAYRDAILRGTRYGVTVTKLLGRVGAAAVTGPDSVFGQFAAMGYSIAPHNSADPTAKVETRNYTGGHTVELYGSHNADGIDAMQLEFGRNLRNRTIINRTAQDAARAIATFYQRFLQ